MKEYLFPVAVVESHLVSGAEKLLVRQPLQIGLAERITAEFEKGGHVILDFGRELVSGYHPIHQRKLPGMTRRGIRKYRSIDLRSKWTMDNGQ